MTDEMLEKVKSLLNVTGNYQDETIANYIDEVIYFIEMAGVKRDNITAGLVAQGVKDLWNSDGGNTKLSPYFIQRVIQLAGKK